MHPVHVKKKKKKEKKRAMAYTWQWQVVLLHMTCFVLQSKVDDIVEGQVSTQQSSACDTYHSGL